MLENLPDEESNMIKNGEDVLLYLDERRNYLIKVEEGKKLHTHKGFIELKELVGKSFGSSVKSSLGVKFHNLRPLVRDRITKMDRRTQIMYPKDIGYLMFQIGIGPGSRVVEAGTGSGALTCALANSVKPHGRVYSYEINPKFQNIATKNIQRAQLLKYVELKRKDVVEGIDEEDVDAVILDMATPWHVVSTAYNALRGSGVFASFSPTIEQVMKTVSTIKDHLFVDIETIELILRKINVETNKTRPQTLMIGHSGYVTTARKISV